ncbi:MAG: PEGA domain-containing protein, partial [Patescibacteria group bacterium]|nr:PEGA domain-containing protein [Patescibacteria group bacterium]
MEHEKRKIKRQNQRLIVMGVIIPTLAAVAVAIVFYAFGWRFDTKNKELYLSSVLYLRSQPLEANIYINDKLQGKTKQIQRQVKPGIYNLKLLKDEFMPWEAVLDVPPSSVVEVDPYLFYQKPKLQNEIVFEKYLASHKQKISFIQNGKLTYCDLPCEKFQILDIKDLSFSKIELGDKKIYLEYNNYFLSINLTNQKQEKINKPSNTSTKKYAFTNTGIYVLNANGNLYQLTKTTPILIQEKVKSIVSDQEWLYFLTQDGELSAKLNQIKNIATNHIAAKNFEQNELKISDLSLKVFPNDTVF